MADKIVQGKPALRSGAFFGLAGVVLFLLIFWFVMERKAHPVAAPAPHHAPVAAARALLPRDVFLSRFKERYPEASKATWSPIGGLDREMYESLGATAAWQAQVKEGVLLTSLDTSSGVREHELEMQDLGSIEGIVALIAFVQTSIPWATGHEAQAARSELTKAIDRQQDTNVEVSGMSFHIRPSGSNYVLSVTQAGRATMLDESAAVDERDRQRKLDQPIG